MASRFPALTLALGCAIVGSGTAQERADSTVLTQVIEGHTLRQAGVVRVADLLTLLDDWDPATIDELTWQAQPAGAAPLADARWMVLVDGQRLDLDLFGTTSLNRLPLPLGVIERVEVTRTPLIAGGDLATYGVIHFHTIEGSRGFRGGVWGTTGSEINDPGPFAVTPRATPNVDRIGNDLSGDVAYGGRGWSVAGGLRFGRHNFTDPAIVTRYGSAAGDLGVKVTLVGGWGRAGVRTARGRHDLLVLRSRLDDHLPLDPFATELAVREQFTHVGASGTLDAGRRTAISYTASWSANDAAARGSAAMPFAWRAEVAALGGEVAATAGSLSLTSGARVRRIAVNAARPIDDDRLLLGTVYGSAAITRWALAPVLRGAVTLAEGEAGVAAALGSRWRPAPGWLAQGELSFTRAVRATDNSIWGWAHRGDSLLTNPGLPITQDGPLRRLSVAGADLALGRTAEARVNVRFTVLWRGYGGATITRQELAPVPITGTFAGPAEVVTDGSGQVLGGLGQAVVRLGRRSRMTVAYRLAGAVEGDDAFRAAAATVPVHALRSTVAVSPAPGLDLWGMITWRSSTTWEDYTGVEAVTDGAYRARVPGWVNLDLAVQKWFWHRRLRLHGGFRNVFGATVRYHPAGAELGSRFLLQGEFASR